MANAFVTKIQKLWKNIEEEYREGRVNSEHALQCVMYMQLRGWTDKERLTIFVEPSISPPGQESPFRPDFLIVENNTVKYVIELKYCPQNFVTFEPDWRKFYWWTLMQKQQKTVEVGINKIEKKKFGVNIEYFLFAYIDSCFRNNRPERDISTKEKVLDLKIRDHQNLSKKIYGKKGMKNLEWMKKKYIQAHGDINIKKSGGWKVFSI